MLMYTYICTCLGEGGDGPTLRSELHPSNVPFFSYALVGLQQFVLSLTAAATPISHRKY